MILGRSLFTDRRDAGRKLAHALTHYSAADPVNGYSSTSLVQNLNEFVAACRAGGCSRYSSLFR